MRLSEIMSGPVETVAPGDTLDHARERMRFLLVHHLVVAVGRRAVGVISARDLLAPDGVDRTVADRMHADPVTATEHTTLRQAANLLRGRTIGCLPVLDERGRLSGIVTTTDFLELIG